jgi:lipopolysaccharide export LptBFGC system permease protein LptF
MVNKVSFANGAWTGDSGWVQSFPDAASSVRSEFQKRTLTLESPEAFSGMHNRTADLMTYGDLRQYAADMAAGGLSVVDVRVELARRLAFPMVTLVMTVLGISFGVSTGRRGALYGVGLALLLGAGYWLIDTFFVAIGQAGLLSPWFAAWAANLLFMALAVYAILSVRT